MKAQRAVGNMIDINTALPHIGNFDTWKRTGLKRAVGECVYYKSDDEKIKKHILRRLTIQASITHWL